MSSWLFILCISDSLPQQKVIRAGTTTTTTTAEDKRVDGGVERSEKGRYTSELLK